MRFEKTVIPQIKLNYNRCPAFGKKKFLNTEDANACGSQTN